MDIDADAKELVERIRARFPEDAMITDQWLLDS